MIVVPIARDRVLLVAMVLCWALAASCGLLYQGGRIARPLEELLNALN